MWHYGNIGSWRKKRAAAFGAWYPPRQSSEIVIPVGKNRRTLAFTCGMLHAAVRGAMDAFQSRFPFLPSLCLRRVELSWAREESFWWEPCWEIPIIFAVVSSWRNCQLRRSVPTHSGGVICCWIHPIAGSVSSCMSRPLGLVGHSSALCPPGPRTA